MPKLTALKVKNAGPGVHGDGGGLYLRVKPSGARSWVLRVQHKGKRQDIGLGSLADLSLAEARDKAAHLRKLARQGKNARAERDAALAVQPTFAEAVTAAHAELSKGWSDKLGAAFKTTLETYAVPIIGAVRVDELGARDLVAVLSPIWLDKPAQAQKVKARVRQVLQFAIARGWRSAPVPSPDEVRRGLSRQPKAQHFRAMPYGDVPAFVAAQLGEADTPARLALLFAILTAARSGEVRAARWEQIDIEARTWSRPASIMKAGEAHTVALSAAAVAVLDLAGKAWGCKGLVFPSRAATALSDAALGKMLRDSGRTETVHGFRSSFRDWAAERMPSVPFAVVEVALAHSVGNATERAYLRSDLMALRFTLADVWGRYVAPSLSGGGKVLRLGAVRG